MFDSINLPILFEHERSTNKEFYLAYDKSSMASKCNALDQLVDRYFDECHLSDLIKAKTPKKIITATNRIKRILRSLLWNCYRAARAHDDCFLKISLADISYRKSAPDNPYGITLEIRKVISALVAGGYLERHIGFFGRQTKKGKETRIRPTLPMLQDLKALPDDISEIYVEPEPVRIRRGYVSTLDDASQQHLEGAKETVTAYNEFIRSHDITHPCARDGVLTYQDRNGELRLVNITRKSVQAIYHAEGGGILTYGRIHGGMCQAIPARYRKFILIDDEPTVELDYSSQILHIVAGLEGIQLTGDPYAIPLPFTDYDAEFTREIVKHAIVVMLNTSKLRAMNGAVTGKFRYDPRAENCPIRPKLIREAIFAHHPFLKKYAMKGMGKQLFMYDAGIARKITQTFLDANKVVLPIHDGFIVKVSDKDLLYQTMKSIWYECFHTTIPVKVEK